MPERSVTPAPGIAPAVTRTAGTLFATLYGDLTTNFRREPEHDRLHAVHQRSLAMGWLDDRHPAHWEARPGCRCTASTSRRGRRIHL
jgi:hypothetical protein